MNITVEGQKYEGKTTLAFFLACRIQDRTHAHKIVIFDPKWAFKNKEFKCGGKIRTVEHSESIDEFEALTHEPGTAVAFRPRVDFGQDDEESIAEDFTAFCEAIQLEHFLKHPPDEPIILLVDEAYHLQHGSYVHPALAAANRLATEGKIYIIQATHGPKEVAPLMRRQMDEYFEFRQQDSVDLDTIAERCGRECAERIATLPLHWCVKFVARDRTWTVWSHPEAWYCPISLEKMADRDYSGRNFTLEIVEHG